MVRAWADFVAAGSPGSPPVRDSTTEVKAVAVDRLGADERLTWSTPFAPQRPPCPPSI
jgi:hypothetical protein